MSAGLTRQQPPVKKVKKRVFLNKSRQENDSGYMFPYFIDLKKYMFGLPIHKAPCSFHSTLSSVNGILFTVLHLQMWIKH